MLKIDEKTIATMKKADLQEVLQAILQEKNNLQKALQKAQEDKAETLQKMQDVTGLSAERLQYEEDKYQKAVTCMYNMPAVFTQDTVEYRAQHDAFLQELGRKYIQEVLQNTDRPAGKQAGKRRNTSAGRKAGTSAGKAQDKSANDVYRYLCNTCPYEVQEAEKYSTIKKDGKTVARVYVMRDNKVKALVKEDVAKKAELAYTLMKFNLPASVILQNNEDVDKIVKAF